MIAKCTLASLTIINTFASKLETFTGDELKENENML